MDLSFIGNGKYSGHINQSNIDAIRKVIDNAISKLNPPSQLTTNLKKDSIKNLYGFLIKLKYISEFSDLDSFIWVFGGESKPENFIPVIWLPNRQLLRELLEQICNEMSQTELKRLVPICFVQD